MNRKLSQLEYTNSDTQCNSNFTKTTSALTVMTSTLSSGFKLDSPKMFQRKPTFKIFQRKQRKQPNDQNKICYISPQKSDIFKKYGSFKQNTTDLNSSLHTNNSNQISWKQEYKNSTKTNNLAIDLNESRSILTQINNLKTDDGFRTPKNAKNDFNYLSPTNIKKVSINKLKPQDLNNLEIPKSSFDQDFNILNQVNNFSTPLQKSSRVSIFHDFKRETLKNNPNQQKQNYDQQLNHKNKECDSLKTIHLQHQILRLKSELTKLQSKKIQLEDSSRLFLQQVKGLQQIKQNLQKQNQKANSEINNLQQKLSKKQNHIGILQSRIKVLQASKQMNDHKHKQNQANQNFKLLYFQLSQKIKYLTVENDILKKVLQQKKEDLVKISKLQSLNKKLSAKNKYLNKELEEIQKQMLDNKNKKLKFPLNDTKNKFGNRNSLLSQKKPKIQDKRSVSLLITSSSNELSSQFEELSQQLNNIDNLSIFSNGSSLQLSLELSPEKVHLPFKFKQNSNQQNNS